MLDIYLTWKLKFLRHTSRFNFVEVIFLIYINCWTKYNKPRPSAFLQTFFALDDRCVKLIHRSVSLKSILICCKTEILKGLTYPISSQVWLFTHQHNCFLRCLQQIFGELYSTQFHAITYLFKHWVGWWNLDEKRSRLLLLFRECVMIRRTRTNVDICMWIPHPEQSTRRVSFSFFLNAPLYQLLTALVTSNFCQPNCALLILWEVTISRCRLSSYTKTNILVKLLGTYAEFHLYEE